jgi:hypothetical protein
LVYLPQDFEELRTAQRALKSLRISRTASSVKRRLWAVVQPIAGGAKQDEQVARVPAAHAAQIIHVSVASKAACSLTLLR